MTFELSYFNPKVLEEIESWPVDVLADYARLVELLRAHGPHLRMPHSKAFGGGLFELRAKEALNNPEWIRARHIRDELLGEK